MPLELWRRWAIARPPTDRGGNSVTILAMRFVATEQPCKESDERILSGADSCHQGEACANCHSHEQHGKQPHQHQLRRRWEVLLHALILTSALHNPRLPQCFVPSLCMAERSSHNPIVISMRVDRPDRSRSFAGADIAEGPAEDAQQLLSAVDGIGAARNHGRQYSRQGGMTGSGYGMMPPGLRPG